MATPTFSAKLPDVTIQQLNELAAQFGVSKSQIVIQAVRQLHQQEINMNEQKFVHTDAAKGPYPGIIDGQSVYGYEGRYWIGHISLGSDGRRLHLTPVTNEQRQYLDKNYSYIIDGKP